MSLVNSHAEDVVQIHVADTEVIGMRLYFTGDTHGQFSRFFDNPEFSLHIDDCKHCSPESDVLAIAGDFGGVWQNETERGGNMFEHAEMELDRLEQLPYTIMFIDGNHENFPRLDSYPGEERFGGPVNRIRRNLFRLRQRGHVYEISGKMLLCFGGAVSFDHRVRNEGTSWWPQERSNETDFIRCIEELAAAGRRVNYVLTHIAPIEAMSRINDMRACYWQEDSDLYGLSDLMPSFLQFVAERTLFRRWYFGHSHRDEPFNIRTAYEHRAYKALYKVLVPAETNWCGEADAKVLVT